MEERFKFVQVARSAGKHAFKNLDIKYDRIKNHMLECEEKCIMNVLTQILKRDPEIEDLKKTTRIFRENVHDQYELFYEGAKLGYIKYLVGGINDFEYPYKIGLEFIPAQ